MILSYYLGYEKLKLRDCQDVKDLGFTTSGVYNVTPVGSFSSFKVYCNMEIDQDGWLVSRMNLLHKKCEFIFL